MSHKKKFKYVMGLQSFSGQETGACIVRYSIEEEKVDFIAISEERLIRKKYPYTWPLHSIGYCMEYYGLGSMSEIDLVVSDIIRSEKWFEQSPVWKLSEFDYLKHKLDFDPRKIIFIEHHTAHAASVYYSSGFTDAGIIIIDGNGSDYRTTTFFEAKNDQINYLDSYRNYGIGGVYNAVSQFILGFGYGGEGKTMGLAPFGEPYEKVLEINGKFDGIKTDFSNFMRRMPYSDVLNQINPEKWAKTTLKGNHKKCEDPKDLIKPYFARAAYDLQEETERTLSHLGKELFKNVSSKNICIAGGVALNSVANKKMFDATDFERFFAFPAAGDAGIPFGLAVWGYHNILDVGKSSKPRIEFKHAYTGIEYTENQIKEMIEKYKIPYQKVTLKEVAELIADGAIIGWLQGGSEYGPRALGHRSILADSRKAYLKDEINLKVKHREHFRPFAPAVMVEHYKEYFDLDVESPFMLLVADVKDPEKIPSITHIDNTARVQTVSKENNGEFYELISEFNKITGVPVILNTSFNDAGEPIVETPEDAMICFLRTKIPYLVIGNYLFKESDIDKTSFVEDMVNNRDKEIQEKREEYLNKFYTGYDENEMRFYLEEHNKMAEWHSKYRAKYELEKKVYEWKLNKKRILIVGTRDHTTILLKHINDFMNLDVIGFVDYGKLDRDGENDIPYTNLELSELNSDNYDIIVNSSFEYMYEISELIKNKNVKKPIYEIYDLVSRSMIETVSDLPPYRTKLD